MTVFLMIGIILCGIVGFGGLAGTIYGATIATGNDYDTLIIVGFLFSAMFIASSIWCISLYRKEKAHERKLCADRGADFVAAKRKKEQKWVKRFFIILLAILIPVSIVTAIMISTNSSSSDSKYQAECGYCERTFPKGSEDGKSIAKRGLCKNCYGNMNNMQDALDGAND